jgi:YbbR domain-containing protein
VAEPALATISGPADVLDKTNVIMTAPVDVTGATADIVKSVDLQPPPGITINSAHRVTLSIKIGVGSPADIAPHATPPTTP